VLARTGRSQEGAQRREAAGEARRRPGKRGSPGGGTRTRTPRRGHLILSRTSRSRPISVGLSFSCLPGLFVVLIVYGISACLGRSRCHSCCHPWRTSGPLAPLAICGQALDSPCCRVRASSPASGSEQSRGPLAWSEHGGCDRQSSASHGFACGPCEASGRSPSACRAPNRHEGEARRQRPALTATHLGTLPRLEGSRGPDLRARATALTRCQLVVVCVGEDVRLADAGLAPGIVAAVRPHRIHLLVARGERVVVADERAAREEPIVRIPVLRADLRA
jgi:hypothetical protein